VRKKRKKKNHKKKKKRGDGTKRGEIRLAEWQKTYKKTRKKWQIVKSDAVLKATSTSL